MSKSSAHTAPALANPAPLGLMGFGMTTVLLNLHNAMPERYPLCAAIMTMGIFFGGFAQIIAGVLEFKKGNTFGLTAFTSYGSFWLTLVGLWILPKLGWAEATSVEFMGWYLFMWGLFTLWMFFGTLKGSPVLQFVFGSLTVLFFLLAARDWTGNTNIARIAGWEGIICGFSAIYLAMAETLNEKFGRNVIPM